MSDDPLIVAPRTNMQALAEMGLTLDQIIQKAAHAAMKFGKPIGSLPDAIQLMLMEAVLQGATLPVKKKLERIP